MLADAQLRSPPRTAAADERELRLRAERLLEE